MRLTRVYQHPLRGFVLTQRKHRKWADGLLQQPCVTRVTLYPGSRATRERNAQVDSEGLSLC